MEDTEHSFERLRIALEARQLEIGLFWQRALFFWGFIAAAFVAYATALQKSTSLLLLISGFGLVCSLAFTLANRGSKYWQESWETKVERAELHVIGPWFQLDEPLQQKAWGAKRYSVSKLTIALSDYICFVWILLFANQAIVASLGSTSLLSTSAFLSVRKWTTVVVLCGAPLFYCVRLLRRGKTSPRSQYSCAP